MYILLRIRKTARRLLPALLIALLVVVLFLLAPPLSFEVKVKSVAYGICHQIPERSFFLAGHQLPLCARNTGIFLGALLTFGVLFMTGKGRHSGLPSVKLLPVLGLFTAAMGIDGANSYLTFFSGLPHLYEPSNFLRLASGSFHGMVVALVMFPLFNSILWRDAVSRPIVTGFKELALYVAAMMLLIGIVYAQLDFLYYPIASLSALAVLTLIGVLNSTATLTLLRWNNKAGSWLEATPALLIGLVAALVEMAILGYLRAALTAALGLPF